jgi:CPA2 family monovalent cation:H+ antiporter-2
VFRLAMKLNPPKFLIDGLFPLPEPDLPDFRNHLVIIGKDASALKLSHMATLNKIRHISIVFEPSVAREKMKNGDLVIYGDAVNEPVLRKAHADTADIIVISVGNVIPAMNIIQKIRSINSKAFIIVRSPLIQNVAELYRIGADQVLPEKLEIAIDMFSRVLVKRRLPQREINSIISHARNSNLGILSGDDAMNLSD